MKAPDKIYIPRLCNEEGFEYAWYYNPLPNRRNEEYYSKDAIIALIESRLSEIIGDAQPKPALRAELQELIDKIKNNENPNR